MSITKRGAALLAAALVSMTLCSCNASPSSTGALTEAALESETTADQIPDADAADTAYTSSEPQPAQASPAVIDSNMEETGENAQDTDRTAGWEESQTAEEERMNIEIGGSVFSATLADTTAARELREMIEDGPLTVELSDYSGFEKVGSLGRSLTTSNEQITTVPGDIMLYNGNNIVMFYGTNTWSYTPLAKIEDLAGWAEALGSGDITVVLSVD